MIIFSSGLKNKSRSIALYPHKSYYDNYAQASKIHTISTFLTKQISARANCYKPSEGRNYCNSYSALQSQNYRAFSSTKNSSPNIDLKKELQVTDDEIKNLLQKFTHWKDRDTKVYYNELRAKKRLEKENRESLYKDGTQDLDSDGLNTSKISDNQKSINRQSKTLDKHISRSQGGTLTKTKQNQTDKSEIGGSGNSFMDSFNFERTSESFQDDFGFFSQMKEAKFNDTRLDDNNQVVKYIDSVNNAELTHSQNEINLHDSKQSITEQNNPLFEDELAELSESRFNHVIYTNASLGNIKQAQEAFDLMKTSGVTPSLRTYDYMLFAYANVGDIENAVSIFREIENNGMIPSLYTYSGIIKLYVKTSRLDDAYKVYELMKSRGIMPTESIYNQLLIGCLEAGNVQRAWGTFEHMRFEIAEPSVKAMTIMINACVLDDQVEKALNLMDEMIVNGQTLTDVTFNSLINSCAHRPGYLNNAIQLLIKMEMTGFKPDYYTYNTLLYACAKNRNLEMARLIFSQLMDKQNEFMRLDKSSFANLFWNYSSHINHVKMKPRKVLLKFQKPRTSISVHFNDKSAKNTTAQKEKIVPTESGISEKGANAHQDAVHSKTEIKVAEKSKPDHENLDLPLENGGPSKPKSNTETNLVTADGISKFLSLDDTKKKEAQYISNNGMHLNRLFMKSVPDNHINTLEESKRVYKHFVKLLKTDQLPDLSDDVTDDLFSRSRVLNSYLTVLINHGAYQKAWRFYCTEFNKIGCKRNGWTLEAMLFSCELQREVELAWVIFNHFKKWRKEVESALTINHSNKYITNGNNLFDKQDSLNDDPKIFDKNSNISTSDDFKKVKRQDKCDNNSIYIQGDLTDETDIVVADWFSIPEVSFAGTKESPIPLSAHDQESERRAIGCDMKQEFRIYQAMINVLARADQIGPAIKLLDELKNGISEHPRNELDIADFKPLLSRSIELEMKSATAKILQLTSPTRSTAYSQRTKKDLNKRWGTQQKFVVGKQTRIKYKNKYYNR